MNNKKDINIAIFGLGTVGSSLVKLITKEKKRISNSLNINLNLVSISSRKLPQSLFKYKNVVITSSSAKKIQDRVLNEKN